MGFRAEEIRVTENSWRTFAAVVVIVGLLLAVLFQQLEIFRLTTELDRFRKDSWHQGARDEEPVGQAVLFLNPNDLRKPEIAGKYGIDGYIDVTLAKGTSKILSIERGGQMSVTLLLKFVSHNPNVTEVTIDVNPENPAGLFIEQEYVLLNEKGEIYDRGTINVNKLVTYEPSGEIVIRAGETVAITLTVAIPDDYPEGVDFPIDAVGIIADPRLAFLSDVELMMNA